MENKNYTGTAHINATKGTMPKTVLFPGDPLRAKWIAETFLEDVKLVNEVRGMFAFVGKYKGQEIGVMGSGMGIPSAGIYSYELFKFYDVDNIIRIGTAGAYDKDIAVGTIMIANEAYSESTYADMLNVKCDKPSILKAKEELVSIVEEAAKDNNTEYVKGLIHSSDAFYGERDIQEYIKMGISIVEMEAFGIYANAKKLNKNALAIATVSDNIITGDAMSPEDRQTKLKAMVTLALDAAIKYNEGNK